VKWVTNTNTTIIYDNLLFFNNFLRCLLCLDRPADFQFSFSQSNAWDSCDWPCNSGHAHRSLQANCCFIHSRMALGMYQCFEGMYCLYLHGTKFFYRENGASRFFRNVRTCLPSYKSLYPWRPHRLNSMNVPVLFLTHDSNLREIRNNRR
jgi:hypothetical protein